MVNSGTQRKLNTRQECYNMDGADDCEARMKPKLCFPLRSGNYDSCRYQKTVNMRQYFCLFYCEIYFTVTNRHLCDV